MLSVIVPMLARKIESKSTQTELSRKQKTSSVFDFVAAVRLKSLELLSKSNASRVSARFALLYTCTCLVGFKSDV